MGEGEADLAVGSASSTESGVVASLPFRGDQLRFLPETTPSLPLGEEGLEPAQDFRANVRIVPVTERLRLLVCSPLPESASLLSFARDSSSSCEKEKIALDILFFAFFDALRNNTMPVD